MLKYILLFHMSLIFFMIGQEPPQKKVKKEEPKKVYNPCLLTEKCFKHIVQHADEFSSISSLNSDLHEPLKKVLIQEMNQTNKQQLLTFGFLHFTKYEKIQKRYDQLHAIEKILGYIEYFTGHRTVIRKYLNEKSDVRFVGKEIVIQLGNSMYIFPNSCARIKYFIRFSKITTFECIPEKKILLVGSIKNGNTSRMNIINWEQKTLIDGAMKGPIEKIKYSIEKGLIKIAVQCKKEENKFLSYSIQKEDNFYGSGINWIKNEFQEFAFYKGKLVLLNQNEPQFWDINRDKEDKETVFKIDPPKDESS